MLVLYEWYSYFQSDFLTDIVFNSVKSDSSEDIYQIDVDSIDYQEFKEEQFTTLKHKLDLQPHTCDICYTELQGRENFIALPGCLHFFCKLCVAQYAEDLVMRGEIAKLRCPSFSGCFTYLTEMNLQEVGLNEELIEKYNVFSINNAINAMDDFGWCPITECGYPAQIDKVKN